MPDRATNSQRFFALPYKQARHSVWRVVYARFTRNVYNKHESLVHRGKFDRPWPRSEDSMTRDRHWLIGEGNFPLSTIFNARVKDDRRRKERRWDEFGDVNVSRGHVDSTSHWFLFFETRVRLIAKCRTRKRVLIVRWKWNLGEQRRNRRPNELLRGELRPRVRRIRTGFHSMFANLLPGHPIDRRTQWLSRASTENFGIYRQRVLARWIKLLACCFHLVCQLLSVYPGINEIRSSLRFLCFYFTTGINAVVAIKVWLYHLRIYAV